MHNTPQTTELQRRYIRIQGAVQGVGFRPFIYRLATQMQLKGWVINSSQGVQIEIEGPPAIVAEFLTRIPDEKPPLAVIQTLESLEMPVVGYMDFEIRHSDDSGAKTTLVLPDVATCPDCLAEIQNPEDRRYRYPFTNCTNCGPRFTIIRALPYDRPNTSMRLFPMCNACQAEYDDPLDRRFHAQPNACPECGPHLEQWDSAGHVLATHDAALIAAAAAIRHGQIVAVKGLGGFHLMVDARREESVRRLRERKHRPDKPLAVMMPSLDVVHRYCALSPDEEILLATPQAPIVLLTKHEDTDLAPAIAPDNPDVGVMLPYTPLHHLLLDELDFPVVATSGNLTDEPICIDEAEALARLAGIADVFLVHNRPIVRHVDDSVVRLMAGQPILLRRARGYAPMPIRVAQTLPPILAVGGHLKNTIAVSVERNVFISQHIGDLETAQAFDAFRQVIEDFQVLYDIQPEVVACDLHPDYRSTRYAESLGLPIVRVQHHYAHILSCMAENAIAPPALGIVWDGTGYGPDGTIWGGEFLRVHANGYERVATLRPFPLPGGDLAVKEPRRSALGLLYAAFGEAALAMTDLLPIQAFSASELPIVGQMLRQGLNTPITSSAGRLFDAIAALVGMRQQTSFEGQAAMQLEFAVEALREQGRYRFEFITDTSPAIVDWEPMLHELLSDWRKGTQVAKIAAKFHNSLAAIALTVAKYAHIEQVGISGGCFQNTSLTNQVLNSLRSARFRPFWHRHVPPNDGGIALGQIIAVQAEVE
ncbi:MAG: carbamoyltransferase HypF [Chloroflexi bacterium]|nr:carbamoyltransferase HypF [Chloroflexota bacterium]